MFDVLDLAKAEATGVTPHRHRVGHCIVGIESTCLHEKAYRFILIGGGPGREVGKTTQVAVVGVGAAGWLTPSARNLSTFQLRCNGRDHLLRYIILECEHILDRTLEAVGPCMGTAVRIDQLGRDAQTIGSLAHASLKHILHSKLATDLPQIW